MRRGARLAALLAVPALGLGFAGCGSDSVSKDELKEALVKQAQLPENVAGCITDEVFAKFDQDQLKKLKNADSSSELSAEETQVLTQATVKCIQSSGGGTTTSK